MRLFGRWCRRQDQPDCQLHDQWLPVRVRSNGHRHLRRRRPRRRRTGDVRNVRYSRAGRLRHPAAARLPGDRRLPALLLRCQPFLLPQRARKVDPGTERSLEVVETRSRHSRRDPVRPPNGRQDPGGARPAQGDTGSRDRS